MKTFLLCLIIAGIAPALSAQTPEAIQLQIDDLEEAKENLQTQINEIDSQISELTKTKHELSLNLSDHGFLGYTTDKANLTDKASTSGDSKILTTVPANTLLIVNGLEKGRYKTAYGGVTGWIPTFFFKLNNPEHKELLKEARLYEEEARLYEEEERKKQMVEQARREQQIMKQQREAAILKQQREADILKQQREAAIKTYSQVDAQRILDGKIWIGMTKEMMIYSWGQPKDINRSVGSWGVNEQCIYGDTYVYVENGKVTSWQD